MGHIEVEDFILIELIIHERLVCITAYIEGIKVYNNVLFKDSDELGKTVTDE